MLHCRLTRSKSAQHEPAGVAAPEGGNSFHGFTPQNCAWRRHEAEDLKLGKVPKHKNGILTWLQQKKLTSKLNVVGGSLGDDQ